VESFIKAFIAYFVIVDPVGTALIFNGLTAGKDEVYCRRMAARAVFFSVMMVLCFGLWGRDLLMVFGIQMDSFRIAGGLLIFYAAFGMITQPNEKSAGADVAGDISVFPLAIPLIAGPGCLTLTILLFSKAQENNAEILPLLAAIAIVFLMTLMKFFDLLSQENLQVFKAPSLLGRQCRPSFYFYLKFHFLFF